MIAFADSFNNSLAKSSTLTPASSAYFLILACRRSDNIKTGFSGTSTMLLQSQMATVQTAGLSNRVPQLGHFPTATIFAFLLILYLLFVSRPSGAF
jgi:hypothetical protein